MHKDLPWFKWYPTDADSDEHFRLMDDADIGFYIRCLNHAWVNGGIPADAGERAKALRTRKDTADKRWIRVAPCFKLASELGVTLPNAHTILCNPRQEVERKLASHISEVRAESAKRKSNSRAIVPIRASDSVSVSDSDLLPGRKENLHRAREVQFLPPASFTEFIRPWVETKHCGDPAMAMQMWIGAINGPDDEAAAFASRDRYFSGDSVSRGFVMEPKRFISEQSACGWAGTWAAPQKKPMTPYESLMEKYAKEAKNGSKHD